VLSCDSRATGLWIMHDIARCYASVNHNTGALEEVLVNWCEVWARGPRTWLEMCS
jgi:hypothetical protein